MAVHFTEGNRMSGTDRRSLLKSVAAGGLALPVLAACGGRVNSRGEAPTSGQALVAASDVPVQGGVILNDKLVVVTQPEAGTYKAFSATCTHMGCTVAMVRDNVIVCPCHGSEFSAQDGSVVRSPASRPLPPVPIVVNNGEVVTR
jgi:Rieske Fe-S protein